jgi:mannose-6-phosphate isomerase-like protein (cupin superfamily)
MGPRRAQRVRLEDLELLDRKVTREGGALRYLEGARYGLRSSIYRSTVVPGGGPLPHTHRYDEVFVIESGQARFFADDAELEAGRGDVVIVPAGAVHGFVNIGTEVLRHVAIHDGAERAVSTPIGDAEP